MKSYKKLNLRIIESYDDILTAAYSDNNTEIVGGTGNGSNGSGDETDWKPNG